MYPSVRGVHAPYGFSDWICSGCIITRVRDGDPAAFRLVSARARGAHSTDRAAGRTTDASTTIGFDRESTMVRFPLATLGFAPPPLPDARARVPFLAA